MHRTLWASRRNLRLFLGIHDPTKKRGCSLVNLYLALPLQDGCPTQWQMEIRSEYLWNLHLRQCCVDWHDLLTSITNRNSLYYLSNIADSKRPPPRVQAVIINQSDNSSAVTSHSRPQGCRSRGPDALFPAMLRSQWPTAPTICLLAINCHSIAGSNMYISMSRCRLTQPMVLLVIGWDRGENANTYMNLRSAPVSGDFDSKAWDTVMNLTMAVSCSNQAIAKWMRVVPDCPDFKHYFLLGIKTHNWVVHHRLPIPNSQFSRMSSDISKNGTSVFQCVYSLYAYLYTCSGEGLQQEWRHFFPTANQKSTQTFSQVTQTRGK